MVVLKHLGTGGATASVKKTEEPKALGRAQIPHASFNHGSALLLAGDIFSRRYGLDPPTLFLGAQGQARTRRRPEIIICRHCADSATIGRAIFRIFWVWHRARQARGGHTGTEEQGQTQDRFFQRLTPLLGADTAPS